MNDDLKKDFSAVSDVLICDETGREKSVAVVNEYPLTININGMEIVTLMTLGTAPEDLVMGYLRNQRLIQTPLDILSIRMDWERETAFVKAKKDSVVDLKGKTRKKIVTTGCGEGTVFSCSLDKIYETRLVPFSLSRCQILDLCKKIKAKGDIYPKAGSVHTCALCSLDQVIFLVEDVGRHNAADSIAGQMWKHQISGHDKILYTTGRVTSEIVIKAALMKVPVLLSRSGVTKMGLDIARDLNMVIIARAKAKKFMVYHGHHHIDFLECQPNPS